jgi:hypothetical protein
MRFHLRILTPLLTVWALAAPAAAQIDQGRLTGTVRMHKAASCQA